jgi:hypothetical protein
VAEEDKPIKVSDFRMFTPDGRLRPGYEDLEDASSPPASVEASPEPAAAQPDVPAGPPESGGEVDEGFSDLLRSLATSAYAALGFLAEPGSKAPVELAEARRIIDWLALLEKKTRNNLTFAEQNLLTRALYELRLAFVEVSGKPGGRPR